MKKKLMLISTILTILIGCSNNATTPDVVVESKDVKIIITTTDYSDGGLSVYDTEQDTVYSDVISIDSDNRVVVYGGDVYVLERGNGKVLKISGYSIDTTGYLWELTTGASSNPHDIIFASSTKAYVPLYGMNYMLVINPTTGDSIGAISLASYVAYAGTDSAETTPKMSLGVIENGKLYVICQKLKGFTPVESSILAVINITTDVVDTIITLNSKNCADIKSFGGKLYVSSTGSWYDATDGAVEVVDLSTNTSSILIGESSFDGNISSFVIYSATKAYMLVAMADWKTAILPFNISAKSVETKVGSIGNAGVLVLNSDTLYVGDRDSDSGGLTLINISDNSKISGPKSTGLLPNSLAILKDN